MSIKEKSMSRRNFLDKSVKAAAAVSVLGVSPLSAKTKKQRLALVGTGTRGINTWGKKLLEQFPNDVEMVALCDINIKRAAFAQKYINTKAPIFHSADFDLMIKKTKPDTVIVTTTDAFHAKYAIRAMELGCNVISEKPLVIEREQAQALLDAEKRTGRNITIGFNARFENGNEEIKRVVTSGELGKILFVTFQENLDLSHGASYFRRWHRFRRYSGTLLLHKSVHHFDKLNWIIESEPDEVFAYGKLGFYGKNSSIRGKNCRSCVFKKQCDFYWDITKSKYLMDLYVNNENVDGYLRDGCVFDSDIDIYDSSAVTVKYKDGVLMNYSINNNIPFESQKISITGDKGRLDVDIYMRQSWQVDPPNQFRLTKNSGETKTWGIQNGEGTHGGADSELRKMIFGKNVPDPYNKLAGSRAGILASLVGVAARESIETGKKIKIDDMVKFPHTWRW